MSIAQAARPSVARAPGSMRFVRASSVTRRSASASGRGGSRRAASWDSPRQIGSMSPRRQMRSDARQGRPWPTIQPRKRPASRTATSRRPAPRRLATPKLGSDAGLGRASPVLASWMRTALAEVGAGAVPAPQEILAGEHEEGVEPVAWTGIAFGEDQGGACGRGAVRGTCGGSPSSGGSPGPGRPRTPGEARASRRRPNRPRRPGGRALERPAFTLSRPRPSSGRRADGGRDRSASVAVEAGHGIAMVLRSPPRRRPGPVLGRRGDRLSVQRFAIGALAEMLFEGR